MKINLVLAPEQDVAILLKYKKQAPNQLLLLGKLSQLAGLNVLIFDQPELVERFNRPLTFNSLFVMGEPKGKLVHQVSFKSIGNDDEHINNLLEKMALNGVLAQQNDGKSEYMLWTFWDDADDLALFIDSQNYQQLHDWMRQPFSTTYHNVENIDQISLTHKMRDTDKEWWG